MSVETLYKGNPKPPKMVGQCPICRSVLRWIEKEGRYEKGTATPTDAGFHYIYCPVCRESDGDANQMVVGEPEKSDIGQGLIEKAKAFNKAQSTLGRD